MVARTHELQRQSAGIGHIRANVEKIFEEPEPAEGNGRDFPSPEKISYTQERHDQFAERAAENGDGVAKPTEEEMAAFMNDEIHVVDKEKSGTIGQRINKEQRVENEPRDSNAARDRLPCSQLFFEKSH